MSEIMELTSKELNAILPNAMLYRGVTKNLDECKQWGCYITDATTICANPPEGWEDSWKYAIVEVLVRVNVVIQRLSHPSRGEAWRSFNGTAWGAWKKVLME